LESRELHDLCGRKLLLGFGYTGDPSTN
jgi:hypothetical protein